MTPPKTLHLTNAYHGTSGGIRTFYHALMAEAEVQGRPIRLVVPGRRAAFERHGSFGAVHTVAAPPAPLFDRRYHLLWPAHYAWRGSQIARILAEERPDIVEVNDKYSLCHLARLLRHGWPSPARRPTVVGLSCERLDDNVAAFVSAGRLARRAAGRYLRHVYAPSFDVHLANSAYTARELHDGAGLRDVEICPPGVDAALFGAARRDESLRGVLLDASGGGNASVLVFYAGRLSPEKNLPLLLDAVGVLARRREARGGARDVRLVMAGEGPERATLQARAARVAPGRVHFIGHLRERQALAAHYASADVFAHPNPREPFGIGPLEAMAAGVPVVAPAAGGVLTYANHANAWLARPDPAALAEAMLAAAAGRDSERVRRARETAAAFNWPRMAQRYFEAIDRRHAGRVAGADGRVAHGTRAEAARR